MRWTDICWSCSIGLVFQGVLAEIPLPGKNGARTRGAPQRPDGLRNRLFPQQVLGFVSATVESATIQSTTTIYEPKITQAPLLRRKLGSNKWDLVHEGIQGQKRDAASCPSDYQLCPQSMNGGCCPNDRVCGTSSCFASSAAPASACGKLGYIACGINEGGGCCPSDYVCGKNGCTPSVGVSPATETCGANSYLCPASLNYGCCKNGMGCGLSDCYSTEIVSLTLTETTTTTDAGVAQTLTSTITTTITPQSPIGIATTVESGLLPKVTSPPEEPIAKTKESKTSSEGGLSKSQLGGIIGGAVLILIVLLIASFCIIRRLNKVKVIVEASRSSSSGPRPCLNPAIAREIDAMSDDPFLITPSDTSTSMRQVFQPIQPPSVHSSHHEVEASSPPILQNPWSPRSPPSSNYNYPSGYAPVATSDSASGTRNHSVDFTPGASSHQSPVSYFDISPHPDLRDQNLRFGHTPPNRRQSKHERQWSQSSEQSQVSQVSQTSSGMAELDAYPEGERRTSFHKALYGLGMGRLMSRRKSSAPSMVSSRKDSDPMILTGGPGRPDWLVSPVGLGHIPEAGESRLEIQEASPGLTNAGLRELTLMEREAYQRKEDHERSFALHNQEQQYIPNQREELLRDVDLGG